MLVATAALSDSTGPGVGMAIRFAERSSNSEESPLPSLPMRNAAGPDRSEREQGIASVPAVAGTAAKTGICRSASAAKVREDFSAITGMRKADPAEARRALAFQILTVPGRAMTPLAPKASAERTRVPKLPGSCKEAVRTTSGMEPDRASANEKRGA